MAAKNHGTRQRYGAGCRCVDCKAAQCAYQRRYRERKANRADAAPVAGNGGRSATVCSTSICGRSATYGIRRVGRPARDQRFDSGRAATRTDRNCSGHGARLGFDASNSEASGGEVLVSVLDTLHKGSAQARRGNLAMVKSMTKKGGA
jgi:hypothetical protein